MTDLNDFESAEDQDEESSLAPWQQFVRQWQGPIAFGPFALFIFACLKFFPDATASWLFLCFAFATVIWAIVVVGYALYLKYME